MEAIVDRINFGIVGAGWRAEFYLRIAKARPDLFIVDGVVVRNPQKAKNIEEKWRIPVCRELDEMLSSCNPLFVVTSVPRTVNPGIIRQLVERGIPVLSETPPALDLPQMLELYRFVCEKRGKVQVAEQYFLQPHHASRLTLIESGLIGKVSHAQISSAHGYHGISLMRKSLGLRFQSPTIYARQFIAPIVSGPGRDGPPLEETVRESIQQFFWLDFGDCLGFLDFTRDQYFSWIRTNRVLIRGDRGEICDNTIAYLKDFRTPIRLEFRRRETGIEGNLEGNCLESIQLGSDIIYENPLARGRLSDDEIAVGACLLKMADYSWGGVEFYSLGEACQDHYLSLLCEKVLDSGTVERAEAQLWSR
jgi:hypothetical protein